MKFKFWTSAVIVAIVPAFCGHVEASLANRAWFSLEGVSGPGSATAEVVSSGPHQTLIIRKLGDVNLRIGYNFDLGGDVGPAWTMHSWSIHLDADANSGSATFENGAFTGLAGYDSNLGGTNGTSSFDAGQISSPMPNVNGTTGLAYEFDLVVTNQDANDAMFVTGDFGPWGQLTTESGPIQTRLYPWYGTVGANPASYGFPNYTWGPDVIPGWGPFPVIVVYNFLPEPFRIFLVAMGAAALVRSRKR